MNRLSRIFLVLSVVLFLGAGIASADTLLFTLTGPVSASFELPSGVLSIPSFEAHTGFGFTITPASLMVNGSPSADFLTFYNSAVAVGGGVGIFASGTVMDAYAAGPQLYGGTETSPSFAPGSFTLTNGVGAGTYSLTIADITPGGPVGTPEPSVTILLGAGLLALGLLALRFKPGFSTTAS